jgi:hypothetical protein
MKKSHKLRRRISNIGCGCFFGCENCQKRAMSELMAVSCPDLYRAGEVRAALQRLQQEFLIEMEDAAQC